MIIDFLGTGTSHGIPVASCSCDVCSSQAPENSRYRSSISIRQNGKCLIIDTTPEFRLQTVRARIKEIDGVLITHAHADHLHGIDDLRPFSWKKRTPIWAKNDVCREIEERFPYIFNPPVQGGGTPQISLHKIEPCSEISVSGIKVLPVPIYHGNLEILGFRIGGFAYVTDCSRIPDSSMELLKGVETLALGALRYKPHETHFSIPEALEVIKKISPQRAYLTHLCHDVDHFQLMADLPEGVEPARDSLQLTIPD